LQKSSVYSEEEAFKLSLIFLITDLPRKEKTSMTTNDPYAKAAVWDTLHARDKELNPQGWWVPGLLPFLTRTAARTVLDVGCGTGADAIALAQIGFQVTATDYSEVALARARDKAAEASVAVEFQQADMALPFPFADECCDAVMSNVAMHMFDDQTTRRIIGEMRRVLGPAGLLLLHVNSTEDMPYREKQLEILRVQTLSPDFYRESNGQTMHFFSEQYCRDVLAGWQLLDLTYLYLRDEAGAIIKCVWRCVAQKNASCLSPEEKPGHR
jgi:SAM-dependent methyltransferase